MIGSTNVAYFTIVPKTVASCVWDKFKKYSLLQIGFKVSFAFTWRTDPDTASEGAKIGKVFFLAGSLEDTGEVLLRRSKYIDDAKVVKEGVRPNLTSKVAPSRIAQT